jgi:hypothetical protein
VDLIIDPGFGWRSTYCWRLQAYDGFLYLVRGIFLTRTVIYLDENPGVMPLMRPLIHYLSVDADQWGSPIGGDLYRTSDGVHWESLFLDGPGNGDNHGIRTPEPTPMRLFIGMENPFSRLEIWRLQFED